MFEQMVKDAALPLICDVLDAVETAVSEARSQVVARLSEAEASGDYATAAIMQAQCDVIDCWVPAVARLGDELDRAHEAEHGTPARRAVRILR